MRGKFVAGVTAGALMGAAMGMMLMPELDRGTKRRIKRTAKTMRNIAGDAIEDMMDKMK